MSEKNVHLAVVNYLKLQYPKVLFRSDTGAGMKLTIGQAKAQKSIQNGMKWPDIFIAEPRGEYHGLFLELKDEGVILFKKNVGVLSFASEHMTEQHKCLCNLSFKGYMALFAVGFDEAKQIIDEYMNYK